MAEATPHETQVVFSKWIALPQDGHSNSFIARIHPCITKKEGNRKAGEGRAGRLIRNADGERSLSPINAKRRGLFPRSSSGRKRELDRLASVP